MINFQNLATNLQTSVNEKLDELADLYAENPVKADIRLNNVVISQAGEFPLTPISYFQRCGDSFLYKQTCEHRDRIVAQTIKEKDEYYAKYQAIRLQMVTAMTYQLTQRVQKDKLLLDFQAGQAQLQKTISSQFDKVQSLKKFEAIAWTIFSAATATVSAGNKVVMSASLFATNALKDISEGTTLNVNSLHRFSEEPANFSEKPISTKGLQWDHVRQAVLYTRLLQEYESVYFTLFPEMKPLKEKETAGAGLLSNPLVLLSLAFVGFKIFKS